MALFLLLLKDFLWWKKVFLRIGLIIYFILMYKWFLSNSFKIRKQLIIYSFIIIEQ